jgi:hypothetical protein
MRARRADGEEVSLAPHEDDCLSARVPEERHALANVVGQNACAEVRPLQLAFCVRHPDSLLSRGHRPAALKAHLTSLPPTIAI